MLHQVCQNTASRPLRFIYDPVGYCLSCGRTRQDSTGLEGCEARRMDLRHESTEGPELDPNTGNMGKHGEDVKVPHRPTMSISVQWLDPQVWTWDITSGVFAHSRKLAGAPNIRSFIAFLLLCFDTATRLILTSCHVGATKLTKFDIRKIINCRSSTQFQKRISTAKQSKQGCCTKNTTLDNIMITLEPVHWNILEPVTENLGVAFGC